MHSSAVSAEPIFDLPEIAAGSMQLQPIDDTSRCGAIAALGRRYFSSQGAWVARDAVSANPRAYVAIIGDADAVDIVAAAGIVGTDEDAAAAVAVVRRFAREGLGLRIGEATS